jgi:hypothetical protein
VAGVDVQTDVAAVRAQRASDGPQDALWVGGVVDDVEGGDHVVVAGDAVGHVKALEADPVGDAGGLGVGAGGGERAA